MTTIKGLGTKVNTKKEETVGRENTTTRFTVTVGMWSTEIIRSLEGITTAMIRPTVTNIRFAHSVYVESS